MRPQKHYAPISRRAAYWITFVTLIALATLDDVGQGRAGTPYEAQLAGRINAILTTFIIGEFGGSTRQSDDASLNKRICKPNDYAILKNARDINEFKSFDRSCRLIETIFTNTIFGFARLDSIAYLPAGYCDVIRTAFESVLSEKVHAIPPDTLKPLIISRNRLTFETVAADRELLRGTTITALCKDDGSLLVSSSRRPH